MKKIILLISIIGINNMLSAQNDFNLNGNVLINNHNFIQTGDSYNMETQGAVKIKNYLLLDSDGDFTGGNYYTIQDHPSENYLRIGYGFNNNLAISSLGNIGIGTKSPVKKLDVRSSGIGAHWISGVFGATTSVDRVIMGNHGGTASIGAHNSNLNGWANLSINFGGGNVGIGTKNPNSKLDISSSHSQLRLTDSDDGDFVSMSYSSDMLSFRNNVDDGSTPIMALNDNGNVGIGTTNPVSKLDVRTVSNKGIRLNSNDESAISFVPNNSNSIFHLSHGHDNKLYLSHGGTVGQGKLMTFVNNGNIGIGTTTPDSKLTVKGLIHSREVKVTAIAGGADFVFNKDYDLPTLEDVESYINKNKHLPEIASAKEMEKDGIHLAEMNIKLLQKIEELTLYTIQQQKEIQELKTQNIKINKQEAEIVKIKAILSKLIEAK